MENYSDICLIILLIYLCNFRCNSCEIKAKAPCIFPFIYKNKTYDSCTKEGSESDEFWCATKVDSNLESIGDNWGYCSGSCPLEGPNQKGVPKTIKTTTVAPNIFRKRTTTKAPIQKVRTGKVEKI